MLRRSSCCSWCCYLHPSAPASGRRAVREHTVRGAINSSTCGGLGSLPASTTHVKKLNTSLVCQPLCQHELDIRLEPSKTSPGPALTPCAHLLLISRDGYAVSTSIGLAKTHNRSNPGQTMTYALSNFTAAAVPEQTNAATITLPAGPMQRTSP